MQVTENYCLFSNGYIKGLKLTDTILNVSITGGEVYFWAHQCLAGKEK